MADIHIPQKKIVDDCGFRETLTIHFDQDYTLCAQHPESFTGAMGGLPVGHHRKNFTWTGHPNPSYPGPWDILYCFEPGNVPCSACQPPVSPGIPTNTPRNFAGHIIHVGGGQAPITRDDVKRLIDSLESVADSKTFQSSWPATMVLLQELIALKKHPLPASLEEVLELLVTEGQAAYDRAKTD
jgi:hypothetical protein